MPQSNKAKGPWLHRFLVGLFTGLFAVLIFWALDFVIDDIGSIRGPEYTDVEKRFLSPELRHGQDTISSQLAEIGRNRRAQKERQDLLRDSTSRYEATLKQLLEMQRLNAQRGISAGEPQQRALTGSVNLFLSNQQRDQALNEDIARLSEQERLLQTEMLPVEEKLEAERKKAREEFEKLERRHDRKLAAFKLMVLLPLLGLVVFAFARKRGGLYAPIVYAAGVAILWQTVLVIHHHFPTRYFKYIILSAAILIVLYILISLLQIVRSPKPAWLLKQYREAYAKFFCPVCDYPIRRGPRRYLFWTRRSIGKTTCPTPTGQELNQTYTCPACGSRLYEECPRCKAVRHSLLPFCENCGAEKPIVSIA